MGAVNTAVQLQWLSVGIQASWYRRARSYFSTSSLGSSKTVYRRFLWMSKVTRKRQVNWERDLLGLDEHGQSLIQTSVSNQLQSGSQMNCQTILLHLHFDISSAQVVDKTLGLSSKAQSRSAPCDWHKWRVLGPQTTLLFRTTLRKCTSSLSHLVATEQIDLERLRRLLWNHLSCSLELQTRST